MPKFVELETKTGTAYVVIEEVVCVGPPYVKKAPGRRRKDAEPVDEPEASRMVGMRGGQNVWILDTDDNMAALGIED